MYISAIHSAFKLLCMARGKKLEETKIKYALLAQVVREGGFKIPVIMRLSVIPGHCPYPLRTPSAQFLNTVF